MVDGIPVTSVARTLLDCAPVVGRRGTEKLSSRRPTGTAASTCGRSTTCWPMCRATAGPRRLRAAIGDAAGARGVTASRTEDGVLLAFRAAGLPEPECNAADRDR